MRAGLIGKNIGYSLSPVIHEYIFSKMGISGTYDLRDIEKEAIEDVLREGYRGLNVTIPYKEEVMRHLTHVDAAAKQVGAVNTLLIEGERITGHNTDVYGAREMMAGLFEEGGRVTVVGSGGAARALITAARQMGAGTVTVCGRSAVSTGKLKEDFPFIDLQDRETLPGGDLIVNATPCGSTRSKDGWAFPKEALGRYDSAADACYSPVTTPLLQEAKKRGMKTRSGLIMLVAQAVKAEEIWLHSALPSDVSDGLLRRLETL